MVSGEDARGIGRCIVAVRWRWLILALGSGGGACAFELKLESESGEARRVVVLGWWAEGRKEGGRTEPCGTDGAMKFGSGAAHASATVCGSI